MSQEILININPKQTRVACVSLGELCDLYIEQQDKIGLIGSIYKGKVVRVLPGIQAAFVDIGLVQAAFLHVRDCVNTIDQLNQALDLDNHKIERYVKEGQEIFVQVTKAPLGKKGARVTNQLSLCSKFLVMLPNLNSIGVSLKIDCIQERERLKNLLEQQIKGTQLSDKGFIIRTAALHEESFLSEIEYFVNSWNTLQQKMLSSKCGQNINIDLDLLHRTARDIINLDTNRIIIDDEIAYNDFISYCKVYFPKFSGDIELFKKSQPIFNLYSIEEQIQNALARSISLKSGGYLVFDQTEAMNTVDVNTGGFVGNHSQEDTVFVTNLEAAKVIARQIRLRNLSGIIIIDFIDMHVDEHKQQVLEILTEELASDPVSCRISEVSALGLVQMTRKRVRDSLSTILCKVCPTCRGSGKIKNTSTVCFEIMREILRLAADCTAKGLLLLAHQDIVDYLLTEDSSTIPLLETQCKINIKIEVENIYTPEQFDVVLL